jgi:hypothetical protein
LVHAFKSFKPPKNTATSLVNEGCSTAYSSMTYFQDKSILESFFCTKSWRAHLNWTQNSKVFPNWLIKSSAMRPGSALYSHCSELGRLTPYINERSKITCQYFLFSKLMLWQRLWWVNAYIKVIKQLIHLFCAVILSDLQRCPTIVSELC